MKSQKKNCCLRAGATQCPERHLPALAQCHT